MMFAKRLSVVVAILGYALFVGCGGGNNGGPILPPGPGPNPFGFLGCNNVPPGVDPFDHPENVDRVYNITLVPDWLSNGGIWNQFSPVINAAGTLELHTRRIIGGTDSQIAIYGCISIDPRVFFTNYFYAQFDPLGLGIGGGAPIVEQLTPIPFSSVTPQTFQLLPGHWERNVHDHSKRNLDAYAFSGPIPTVGAGAHFGNFGFGGVPQNQHLIIRFDPAVLPTLPPEFVNGDINGNAGEGDFEVFYGSTHGAANYFPGGVPFGAPQGQSPMTRQLWHIHHN